MIEKDIYIFDHRDFVQCLIGIRILLLYKKSTVRALISTTEIHVPITWHTILDHSLADILQVSQLNCQRYVIWYIS